MHPQQRHARFNLMVAACAAIQAALSYAVLFPLCGPKAATAAFGFFGICGLWGFGGRFYRKAKDSAAVVMDERDKDIHRRATVIAWAVDWLYWGLICMGPWFVVVLGMGLDAAQEPMIPVFWLPMAYMVTAIVHMSVWSIAVLVLYGRGADGHGA